MMNRRLLVLGCVALLAMGCNKQTTDSGPSSPPGVWGQLTAIRSTRILVTDDDTVNNASERGVAYFYYGPNDASSYIEVGGVMLNTTSLVRGAQNIYEAQGLSLGLSDSTKWSANLGVGNQPLEYNDGTEFPRYFGSVPYTVKKSVGMYLPLTDTTSFAADSIRVYLSDGTSPSYIIKTFAAAADSIWFSPTELAGLATNNVHQGQLGIISFHGNIFLAGSKAFYFTKETRIVQSINISN